MCPIVLDSATPYEITLPGVRRISAAWSGILCLCILAAACAAAIWPARGYLPPFALDLGANVLFFANAFLAGSFALAVILGRDGLQQSITRAQWSFLAFALGLGFFGLLMMPAGLLFAYDRTMYRVAHAIIIVAAGAWWVASAQARAIRAVWRRDEPLSTLEAVIWALILGTFAYVAFLLLHGIEGSDAQTGHLNTVLFWEEARRFVPHINLSDGLPATINTGQPLSGRLLLLHINLLGTIYSTGAFNTVCIVISVLGVFVFGSTFLPQPAARLAALIYLTSATIFREFILDVTDYPANAILLYAVGAALSIAIQSQSRAWLRLTFVLTGLLWGMKYYPVLQLALVVPIAAVLLYRRGLWRAALVNSPWFLVTAGPWLLHYWIVLGNPVWPFLNNVIGGAPFTPKWQLFFDSHIYDFLGRYLSVPGTSWGSARWQHIATELFPPRSSMYSFSPLLIPAIVYWALASFRNRYYLIPLIWSAGFIAIALNSLLSHRYMFLIVGAVAPAIARPIWQVVGSSPPMLAATRVLLGGFVLLIAWQGIYRNEMPTRAMIVRDAYAVAEPIKTLNALPSTARVFGNFQATDVKYSRIHLKVRFFADDDELLCDDWAKLFAVYRDAGATHYFVQEKNEGYPYDGVLPLIERFDPNLAARLRQRRDIYEKNRQRRDEYLRQYGKLTEVSTYRLYELNPAAPMPAPLQPAS